MNTPPLLVAAVLLFWGWQTGHLLLGALMGAALESSRVIRARWSLTQTDFNRLWNICCMLWLAVAAFLFINEGTVSFNDFFVNAGRRPEAIREAGKSALIWFQWFPLIFLPLLLAQVFNEQNEVGLATFSWWLRKQEARNSNPNVPRDTLDVTYPYIALCLLAASATTQRGQTFYFGVAAIVAWSLWPLRAQRQSLVVWSACFAVIAALGYGGHTGLFHLQKKLEQMNLPWFSRFASAGFDDKEVRTRIGAIGKLKMSDRIVLRLRTDGGGPPEYLREASYNTYRGQLWSNFKREFGTVYAENDLTTWKLLPREPNRTLTIAQYLRAGAGLLPLPSGSARVEELAVAVMQTNQFGATKVSGGPGLAVYNARYDVRGPTIDSAVTDEDLRSFTEMEPAIAQVAEELQLRGDMQAKEAMRRVANFFAEKFQYATYLTTAHAATTNETALARFLLHTRSGHCEYFATATTLLLRRAGVPARYAVGYSVQEGSGKKYVVRERHAHAWTLVFYDGAWHDFDTTPSSWNAAEAQHASWLQPVKDFFSDLWFQFSKFRWSKTEWRKYFMWAPVPLLLIALWRFVLGKQWKNRRAKQKEQTNREALAGIDSDFYLIEKHFAAHGLERRASENWSDWLKRVEEVQGSTAPTPTVNFELGILNSLLVLHQRHRFDPRGLSENERAALRDEVARWLAVGAKADRHAA